MGGKFAWVTLATNDSYSLGALVLAHSLRRAGTKYDIAVLITPGVTQVMRDKLATVFTLVKEVNVLDSKDEANLALLARPELGITFTKLHCWRLTEYEKCVFVDADALVIRNCDELFERDELSAAPDVGWPDCFNSGVFVFKPSQQTFASITSFASEKGSFDGGDQGLLNSYFSDWAHKDISKHLPFIYNMCSTATYSYLPAYKQFGENVRIIHFIGATKPWLQHFDTETGIVHPPPGCSHLQPLLQVWWNIFCDNVHPQLSPVMARSTLAPIWHRFTPYSPSNTTSAISQAPIYDDSSHGYRSEIIKYNDYEPPGEEWYFNKPADFSEFHDPWEDYFPPPYSSPDQNQPSQDHFENYHWTTDESSSLKSEQYYDNNERHINYSDQMNRQNYFSVYDDQKNRESEISLGVNLNEEIYKDDNNRKDDYLITFDNVSDKGSGADFPGYNQYSDDQNHRYDSDRNYQPINEHVVVYRTTDSDYSNINYDRNDDRGENFHRDCQNINDQSDNRSSKNFIITDRDFFDNRKATAREDHSDISKFPIRSNELTSNAHPTPMHDLEQHNEQTVENQENFAIDADAGIAGALAKMTLGEPRSSEQVALEEHMRRQGWEQGQIDYMGRDSFENIWKKICNTLSQAPSVQPSPPEDNEEPEPEPENPISLVPITETGTANIITEAAVTSEKTSFELPLEKEPLTKSVDVVDDVEPTKSESSTVQETAAYKYEEAESEPSEIDKEIESEKLSLEENVPDETITETETETEKKITSSEEPLESSSSAQVLTKVETPVESFDEDLPAQDSDEPKVALNYISTFEGPPLQENIPDAIEADKIVPPVVNEVPSTVSASAASPSIESAELVLDSSSVPIQVAESVLQSEPKESVSEEQSPVGEEVVSSVVAPVFESATAVSETVAEPEEKGVEDGNSAKEETYQNGNDRVAVAVDPIAVATPTAETPTPLSDPEPVNPAPVLSEKVEAELPKAGVSEQESEIEADVEASGDEPSESSKSASLTPPDSPSTVCPVRPARTRDPKIPTTPTVTEATPPNSPPIGAGGSLEDPPKTVRKVVRKVVVKKTTPPGDGGEIAEGVEGETQGKKIVKKVVKKVVKKAKEPSEESAGAEASGATEKPTKKVVKVVKKIAKPAESLDVDPSIPETPPAGTAPAPVPPKRKTKTTTTTTTTTTTKVTKSPRADED